MRNLPISFDRSEHLTSLKTESCSFLEHEDCFRLKHFFFREAEMMEAVTLLTFFFLSTFLQFIEANPVHAHKPWENKYLFEGDIVLRRDITDRSAVPKERFLWPNGVIFYRLAPNLESDREVIESAMRHIESKTCIRFEENVSTRSYVLIQKGDGCYSHIGRSGVPQPLSLGNGCLDFGTVVHELLHTVGFYHEHTRSDRDQYIEIFWENIDPEYEDQFNKLHPQENRLINDFDYDSIMMYGEIAFSIDGTSATMKSTKPGLNLVEVHDKEGLSDSDVERINILYHCPS